MIIRLLTEMDLPALLSIEEMAQLSPWSEAAFQRCWEANYPSWVLVDGDDIRGFIVISLASGECHVLNLCVSPLHQRQGIGHQLLRFALTWAKQEGAGIVYLEVRRSNRQAIALYRKMNFKEIGERKNYYPAAKGKQEDALVFARDIGIEDIEI